MWGDIGGWWGGGDAAGRPRRCPGPVRGSPWSWGADFEWWWDEMRRKSAAARSAMKVVAAVSMAPGGAPCWDLLPPRLGWPGLEVVEDVLGGLSLRCCRGAALGPGLGFSSGLGPRCGDGFGWLLSGGLGFQPGC